MPSEVTEGANAEREFTDPYEMQSEEQLRAKAAERGCDLMVGDDRTLLVDLDSVAALEQFGRMVDEIEDTVNSRIAIRDHEILPSRNGYWHGVVRLADSIPDLPSRIALQSALGSDPMREFLLLAEYMLCGEAVNCLFRPRKETPDAE